MIPSEYKLTKEQDLSFQTELTSKIANPEERAKTYSFLTDESIAPGKKEELIYGLGLNSVRICSQCGALTAEGYTADEGGDILCSDKCLAKFLDDGGGFEDPEEYYWTAWEY